MLPIRKAQLITRHLVDPRSLGVTVSASLLLSAVLVFRGNTLARSLRSSSGFPLEESHLKQVKDMRGQTFYSLGLIRIRISNLPESEGIKELRRWNWSLSVAAILTFLSLFWSEMLRRRVRSQKTLLQEWARREVALKRKYQELFENANDIIFTADLEGKLTSINRAAEELTGYSRAEAYGTYIAEYVAEEYREPIERKFTSRLPDNPSETAYVEVVTKSGGKIPLEVRSRRIYEGGNPVGIQGIARDITERKTMEEKLVLREKRLDSFFTAAPAGLAILDKQLRLMRINETLAQVNGLSSQECIGKPIRELLPKLAPVLEPAMQQVLHVGKPLINFSHEGETLGQPGARRHLISSYFPIPALEGGTADLAVITVDVTDRKQAEEALRESEERLNSILASLRDVVWSVAPGDHRILYLNPSTETVYGRKVTEFYQDPGLWLRVVHPEDRERVADSGTRLIETGCNDQEFRIVRPDGEVRWLRDRSRAIRNPEGTIVRLDGISTDITERKHTQEGLKLYKELFAHSNEAVAILDTQFRFLEQNEAHRNLLGYSDEELSNLNVAAITGKDTFSKFRNQAGDSNSFQVETVFRTRSGKTLEVELSAFNILNHTGDVLRYVALVRDITARKRAERERQRAREAAEAANRAKGEFLANMSHEIRTPLNGILGMTELALNTELTEEQREYVTMAKASGETLLTVINDILDFSKMEAGRLDLNPIDFDLRDVLADTLKTLSLRAHQKGLELALHVTPEVPRRLEGDPTRLRQVVVNLVSNAVKFTDHGEVVLHVQAESQAEMKLLLHFTVTDTGIGIPADKQQVIFAPFTQADSSATRRYGGTGLGLAISFQLVELMDGRLWVESQEGKGSTFHFVARFGLPVSRVSATTTPEALTLQGLAALVVDDNATNRRVVEEMLAAWGMRPAMADSGWTGLAAMEQASSAGKQFPLVLIDACMPDMDGFTLAERIKQNPTLAGATIMMLTSAGHRGDAVRCRELGIAAYLHKPIKEQDLLRAVLLALSPQRREAKDAELITRHTLREHRGSLRILLAEDDLVNRQLAEHLLRKSGYQVTAVQNGCEAIAAVQSSGHNAFDVVLMDVQMPEMDGLESTAAIRALEKGTRMHLPIIAMTAHAMKGDRDRFLAAGMDSYISKPVQARLLVGAIEEALTTVDETNPQSEPKRIARSPIDWKGGLARVEGDSELFHELLKLFASEAPAALDKLRASVGRKDPEAIARSAHTLKGSLSNFEADEAVQAACLLENMARNGNLGRAEEAFRNLEKEVDRVLTAIEGPKSEVAG